MKAIAECFMILKQVPKARNQLKKLAKVNWNNEEGDDIEKCWLLLAATFMSVSKFFSYLPQSR